MKRNGFILAAMLCAIMPAHQAIAAVIIPLTVNLSEAVTVTGNPQIAVDVGGTTRYAVYSSGSGTTALTFTLSPQPGDVDLDGIAISSPIQLNGGTLKDAAGNDASLTFTPPDTSGIKIDYPSLKLDFINNNYVLSGTHYASLPALLTAAGGTFSRASIATYYDSTGTLQTASAGTPRFDYDPVTHAAKGILIEENRTNLIYPSAVPVPWYNCTQITNAVIAPDGTMTGSACSATAAGQVSYSAHAYASFVAGTNYTYSIFVKKAGPQYVRISSNSSSIYYIHAVYDLQAGTLIAGSGKIQNIGNGWYRLSATGSGTVSGSQAVLVIPTDSSGVNRVAATAGEIQLYSWGAQLEQGAFPTSYIPTTSASVTRSTDDLSVPVNSTWNGSLSGTTKAAFYLPNLAAASGMAIFSLYTGSNNGYLLYKGTGTATLSAYANATSIIIGTLSPTASAKAAISYDTLSAYTTFNSSSVLPYSNATVSTSTTLLFGKTWFGNQMTGYLETFNYYPTRVADRQLQLLTQ